MPLPSKEELIKNIEEKAREKLAENQKILQKKVDEIVSRHEAKLAEIKNAFISKIK